MTFMTDAPTAATPAPTKVREAIAAIGHHLGLDGFGLDAHGWASFEDGTGLRVDVGWPDDGEGLLLIADLDREITALDRTIAVALMQLGHEAWLAGEGHIGLTRDTPARLVVTRRADPARLDHPDLCLAVEGFLDLVDDALTLCGMGPELFQGAGHPGSAWPGGGHRA